ncbi:MAG: hypothetical protein PETM_01282 [Petrimonas sp.]|uniref:hypothetical protein n=1 Tax=Petrimonas sp. TaxID=2023866 RepID=UPI0030D2E307
MKNNFNKHNFLIVLSISFNIFLCYAFKPEIQKFEDDLTQISVNPITVSSDLQLFIDNFIISELKGGTDLRLHHPTAKEIVLENNNPWEGSGSGFYSVFQDGNLYRMYYSAWNFIIEHEGVSDTPYYLCYAESDDGIHWRKPNLNLVEFQGSKNNNIVMSSGKLGDVYPDLGHHAVFKDNNPNVAPDAVYKAFIRDWSIESGMKGLLAFKSSDGFHWELMSDKVVITNGAFDSQNLAFWDQVRGEYRAYWRYMEEGPIRSIRTATSKDYIHWENEKDLKYFDAPQEQLYVNVIKPYYRAPYMFIGFPIRYVERGWSKSMEKLPNPADRLFRSLKESRFGTAITESLLMVSRDGHNFKRWQEAFLRPGIERTGSWSYGDQYMAWSMVETKSQMEGAPNEISFYAVEGNWGTIKKDMNVLRRYTLRLDGFVSASAPMSGGELITKPLIFDGDKLLLNFSTSAAGEVKVELQDINGKPISGFTLDDCESTFGDTTERIVYWKNGADVSKLKGKSIRIRFFMKDADIYSFKFSNANR